MGNHRTGSHDAYYAALDELDDALDDAIRAIRAEEHAGRITPAQAATERADVLQRHLARLEQLRAQYLGDQP